MPKIGTYKMFPMWLLTDISNFQLHEFVSISECSKFAKKNHIRSDYEIV